MSAKVKFSLRFQLVKRVLKLVFMKWYLLRTVFLFWKRQRKLILWPDVGSWNENFEYIYDRMLGLEKRGDKIFQCPMSHRLLSVLHFLSLGYLWCIWNVRSWKYYFRYFFLLYSLYLQAYSLRSLIPNNLSLISLVFLR